MSDTPTQAAARLLDRASAVPSYGWTAFAGHVQIPRTEDHPGYDINLLPGHHRPTSVALARFIAACDPQTITMICGALAQQAQELDALRAALRWRDVRTDGPPPCDGEAVFDGINSAGYPAAFNAYRATDGDCYMETAEGNAHVMGDLRYWRRHVGPNDAARKEG